MPHFARSSRRTAPGGQMFATGSSTGRADTWIEEGNPLPARCMGDPHADEDQIPK
jgi:hypothetical protein